MSPTDPLENRLREATRFGQLVRVPVCESTQDLAFELSGSGIVWADEQQAGRGRLGRTWHGAPGLDLEVTLRIEGLRLDDAALVASAIPVAIACALDRHADRDVRIKWPNDLLCTGRKLAGVLIDATGNPPATFLIGVGVNVNRTSFPAELAEKATSLSLCSGSPIDREAVLFDVASAIDRAATALADGDLARLETEFRERLGLVGRTVAMRDSQRTLTGTLSEHDLRHAVIEGERVRLATIRSLARA
ncbi:MAG: biotin--[acetyl-CoA-carboxylase] ligase [Planctomycetes bacterium]|nr:biotin--[acetyl-CoA-carboxylase] ligase [Planctomycetota bacterium]